jgi:hypothetical protein
MKNEVEPSVAGLGGHARGGSCSGRQSAAPSKYCFPLGVNHTLSK